MASLIRQLTARQLTARRDSSLVLVIGFSAAYAIYVHENLEVVHTNGQAKFLETVLRRNRAYYAKIVADKIRQKKGLKFAMLAAGRAVLRDAQELVPVDTGNLKESGFVQVIGG